MTTTASQTSVIDEAVERILHSYHTESDILGASKLQTYLNCPKSYEYQYVDKTEVPKSAAMVVGSCAHEVLREAHARGWGVDDGRAARDMLYELWSRTKPSTRKDRRADAEDRVRVLAMDGIPWYLDWRRGQYDIATEERWRCEVPGEDLTLQGTWDRLYIQDGQTVLSDLKSGKMPRGLDTDLQLSLYSWALRQSGQREDALEIVAVSARRVVRTSRTDRYLDVVMHSTVLPTARRIKAGEFPANVGNRFGCSYCDYHVVCPVGQA